MLLHVLYKSLGRKERRMKKFIKFLMLLHVLYSELKINQKGDSSSSFFIIIII